MKTSSQSWIGEYSAAKRRTAKSMTKGTIIVGGNGEDRILFCSSLAPVSMEIVDEKKGAKHSQPTAAQWQKAL